MCIEMKLPKLSKLFKRNKNKATKKQQALINDYEKGKILQIGKDVDNKEYLKGCDAK